MLHYHYVLMDVAFFSCIIFGLAFLQQAIFSLFFAARAISHDIDDSWYAHMRSPVISQIEKQYYLAGLKMSMCER